MNKYKHKIPRDDLKRFAKEIAKKLVASDFKAGRVKDPTKCDEKQQRKVKDYCKQFFDKAAHKHKKVEEEKAARKASKSKHASSRSKDDPSPAAQSPAPNVKDEYADEDIKMSDHELDDDEDETKPTPSSAGTPSEVSAQHLKRKRENLSSPAEHIKQEERDTPRSPLKKLHVDSSDNDTKVTPPPPPPPPPPSDMPAEEGIPNGNSLHAAGDGFTSVEAANGQDVAMDIDDNTSDIPVPSVENGVGTKNSHTHTHDAEGHGQESNFKDMSLQDVKMLAQMEGGDGEDEVEW
jgi:[histone H3]-lysine36 N-trimethyltransferase